MDLATLYETLQNLTQSRIVKSDIARIWDVDPAQLRRKELAGTELKQSELKMIADAFDISLHDLISQGNIKITSQDDILLDYYPEVFGSCGSGVFELSQTKEQLIVPKKAFFTKFSSNKKYSVINAYGNSMQPFIFDKDKLIVEHWEGEQIIDNRPYVFCYENEIFIKRLAKNVNELIITSDNTDYNKIVLSKEELNQVTIIGQIVGLMRDLR